MSLEVNIEKFPNLSSISNEIEGIGERRRYKEAVKSQKAERNSRSSTLLTPSPAKRHNLGRPKSDSTRHTLKEAQPRARNQSAPPCTVIDRNKILNDSQLTEADRWRAGSSVRERSKAFGFLCHATGKAKETVSKTFHHMKTAPVFQLRNMSQNSYTETFKKTVVNI